MKQLYCSNASCSTALSSSDEIAAGLCDHCRNLLQKRHAYAVVCWQCCNPTFIDDKPTEKSRPIIKDKYIMSKTCSNCEPNSDGHRYMNTSGKSEVVLGEGETLIPDSKGLINVDFSKAPKLREVDATEPPSEGSDILTKIQLANQRAEEFLNSLEFEDDYHGESE